MSVAVELAGDHASSSEMSNAEWAVIVAVPVLAGSVAATAGARTIAWRQAAASHQFVMPVSHARSPLRYLFVVASSGLSLHVSDSAHNCQPQQCD